MATLCSTTVGETHYYAGGGPVEMATDSGCVQVMPDSMIPVDSLIRLITQLDGVVGLPDEIPFSGGYLVCILTTATFDSTVLGLEALIYSASPEPPRARGEREKGGDECIGVRPEASANRRPQDREVAGMVLTRVGPAVPAEPTQRTGNTGLPRGTGHVVTDQRVGGRVRSCPAALSAAPRKKRVAAFSRYWPAAQSHQAGAARLPPPTPAQEREDDIDVMYKLAGYHTADRQISGKEVLQ